MVLLSYVFKSEGVPLGDASNFMLGCMYMNVVCKLYEIIVLLYLTIVKYQLGYWVKDLTSQDGYGSREKKGQEELESSRKEDFQGKTVKIKCICVKES